jgi:Zn-dependent protease with chaperone function
MNKQVSAWEAAGMAAGPVAGYFLMDYTRHLAAGPLAQAEGIGGLLLTLVLFVFIPAFLSVFASAIPQSKRYRIVNASLSTFVIVVLQATLGARMIRDLQSFVLWTVFVAFAMGAALTATQTWKAIGKPRKAAAAAPATSTAIAAPAPAATASASGPSLASPRSSRFLTALAILSIPIVLVNILASTLISLGIAAAILFMLLQLPRIPVFLLLGAALAPLAALWATAIALKAIISPGRSGQPAIELEREGELGLYAMADDVARRVGARPVDRIILHLLPTFFVTQAKLELLDGKASGRILALGMPMLGLLSGRQLCAVLAHEFAHFAGKDVLYSTIVAPAYRGIGAAYESLAKPRAGGNVGAVMSILRLPSLLFLANSYEYFATIDRTLQRSRELRADRVAAELYGKASFVEALEKTSLRSALYGKVAGSFAFKEAGAFFSEVDAAIAAAPEAAATAAEELRAEAEDPLDSHPSFAARAAALPELAGSVPEDSIAETPCLEAEARRLSELAVNKLGLSLRRPLASAEGEPPAEPPAETQPQAE